MSERLATLVGYDDPAAVNEFGIFAAWLSLVLEFKNGLDDGQVEMVREAAARLDQVANEINVDGPDIGGPTDG